MTFGPNTVAHAAANATTTSAGNNDSGSCAAPHSPQHRSECVAMSVSGWVVASKGDHHARSAQLAAGDASTSTTTHDRDLPGVSTLATHSDRGSLSALLAPPLTAPGDQSSCGNSSTRLPVLGAGGGGAARVTVVQQQIYPGVLATHLVRAETELMELWATLVGTRDAEDQDDAP